MEYHELKTLADQIAAETTPEANSAVRVGGWMQNILEWVSTQLRSKSDAVIAGTPMMWPGPLSTIPNGYLPVLEEPQMLLIADYPVLYENLGAENNPWGEIDHAAGKFPTPWLPAGCTFVQTGTGYAIASKGGAKEATLTPLNVPTHKHPISEFDTQWMEINAGGDGIFALSKKRTVANGGNTGNAGGQTDGTAKPIDIRNPYVAINWMIKLTNDNNAFTVTVNDAGHLIYTFSDGSTQDAGNIRDFDTVKFIAQDLTEPQKEQVRINIGSASESDLQSEITARQQAAEAESTARQASINSISTAITAINSALTIIQNWKSAMTDADSDTVINTLTELLNLAKNVPEGADLSDLFAAKISTSDIVNNLTSVLTNVPLSAYQGNILKGLIDALQNAFTGHSVNTDIHTSASEKNSYATKISLSGLQDTVNNEIATRQSQDDSLRALINANSNALIWQNSVANFAALATTYPSPQIGWASMVTGEGYIYSWNGSAWKNTGLTAFPSNVATKSDVNPLIEKVFGNLTADKMIEGSGTVTPDIYKAHSFYANSSYVLKVRAKAAGRKIINLYSNTSFNVNATYNLELGTCTGTGASMLYLGNDWWECIVSATASTNAGSNIQIRIFSDSGASSYTGDGVSGIYLQEAFLYKDGDTVNSIDIPTDFTTYTKITCTVSPNVGLYIGTKPDNQSGSASNPTLATKSDVNPLIEKVFGNLTADKMIEGSGTVTPVIYKAHSFYANSNYVLKIRAKAAGRKIMNLYSNTSFSVNATYNLELGTCTGTGASMLYLGNDWWECIVSATASTDAGSNIQIRIFSDGGASSYTGDGVSGIYLQEAFLFKDGDTVNSIDIPTDFNSYTKITCTVSPNVGLYIGTKPDNQIGLSLTNKFSSKKIVVDGDSIMEQAAVTNYISVNTGCIIDNQAKSGSGYVNNVSGTMLTRASLIAAKNPAAVFLAAGTNDYGTNKPLGNASVINDDTQFYSAVYNTFRIIREQNPLIPILVATPIQRFYVPNSETRSTVNSLGLKLIDYVNVIKDVAKIFSIEVIDLYSISQITLENISLTTVDGLHPNSVGAKLMGGKVINYLNNIIIV